MIIQLCGDIKLHAGSGISLGVDDGYHFLENLILLENLQLGFPIDTTSV